jgi:hypothetical protein
MAFLHESYFPHGRPAFKKQKCYYTISLEIVVTDFSISGGLIIRG